MKKTFLTSLLLGCAAMSMPFMANAQQVAVPEKPINVGGVGPAVSEAVKMIPIDGIRFIIENYPAEGIVSMDKEFASNTYEVKLSDGTEIEFNSKGNVIEIDAADNAVLPEEVVQAILPAKTYQALKNDGIASHVESIEVTKTGYEIDTDIPNDIDYFYQFEEIITPA